MYNVCPDIYHSDECELIQRFAPEMPVEAYIYLCVQFLSRFHDVIQRLNKMTGTTLVICYIYPYYPNKNLCAVYSTSVAFLRLRRSRIDTVFNDVIMKL